MLLFKIKTIFQVDRPTNLAVFINKFHTSFIIYLNQKWRKMKGLSANPNNDSLLVNSSDYSFKNNKSVPYGSGQFRRIKKHQDFMKRIVKLVGEIDYAVERHANLIKEKEVQEQKILESRLKPKGQLSINNE
ncbi:large ribosomal subunit protein mL52 [Apis cerana]|uniref:Large ribosomal subunit protein mL52 n=1 Tax=Apis cerana TaxID=7461 RepID=V9IL45_APICE|nr:large ribosomal subunit protein mL52 [Apis cerana]